MSQRGRNTDASGKSFNLRVVDAVWEKGSHIAGRNPSLYRRDCCGNIIYKASYGKETVEGWEIDHIKPVAQGGSDYLENLRPLQSAANAAKGDKYPWNCGELEPG